MQQIFRLIAMVALLSLAPAGPLWARPYLAKPGETPVPIRIATCAISGSFMPLYSALDNRLFDKYALKPEFLLVRGASVSVAALTSNELQFLYCTADAIIPSLVAGADAKMIASPIQLRTPDKAAPLCGANRSKHLTIVLPKILRAAAFCASSGTAKFLAVSGELHRPKKKFCWAIA